MNINENYQLPSEIYDSFEAMDENEPESAFGLPINQEDESEMSVDIDNSLEDDHFLDQFKKIGIRHENKEIHQIKAMHNGQSQDNPLYVDKTLIELSMVPFKEYYHPIRVTNTCGNPVKMRLPQCPFDISCAHHMIFNSGTYEIILDPWQIIELLIKIAKKEGEYGDLYQTITILQQTIQKSTNDGITRQSSAIHIQVEVKFVQPQLRLRFTGCTDILTSQGQKVALTKVQANKLGEYLIQIQMSEGKSVGKLDLTVEARGRCSVYPQSLTLAKETKRINLRCRGKDCNRAALILRVTGTSLCYVFGIQFI